MSTHIIMTHILPAQALSLPPLSLKNPSTIMTSMTLSPTTLPHHLNSPVGLPTYVIAAQLGILLAIAISPGSAPSHGFTHLEAWSREYSHHLSSSAVYSPPLSFLHVGSINWTKRKLKVWGSSTHPIQSPPTGTRFSPGPLLPKRVGSGSFV